MIIKDGDCETCEHFVKDAYGQWVCEFDGECENMVREMTNEEWFCQLPTEEKAEFLANSYPKSVGEALIKISNGDKKNWEVWLKQPHREE